MSSTDLPWEALKEVVADALDMPAEARTAHLAERLADKVQRAHASRLIEACELADRSPLLGSPAATFAAPVLEDVHRFEREAPNALQAALTGRYTIERELARGGMATVYLAHDERHGRPVALKLLSPEVTVAGGAAKAAVRFQREIEFAARLSHPHILPLYDSGIAGDVLFYVTPYVDGETLRNRLKHSGRLTMSDSVRVLRDVARALAYAHRQGVLHRDIKPANILLTKEGDALVADFGVAKGLAAIEGSAVEADAELTDATVVLGTPAYMAPEQVVGDPGIDHRADLYALGAVAYELLTGAAPFAGRPGHEQMAAHLSEIPEPIIPRSPEIPEQLAAMVGRLLSKRPSDRPSDAADVLSVLDAFLGAATPAARWSPSQRRRRNARRAVLGLAVTGALLLLPPAYSIQEVSDAPATGDAIAILPFVSKTENLEDRALSAGLTAELFGSLRSIPGLRVAERISEAVLQQRGLDDRALGQALGVESILRGSVGRDGDRLSVEASVVRVIDGGIVWSNAYEVAAADLFALQAQLVRDVAQVVSPPSLEGRSWQSPTVRRGTNDREAYELYLRGRHLTDTRQRDGLLRALAYFQDAVERDPSYARAYAGMADAWTFLGIFGHAAPGEVFPAARTAARRALEIDSLLAEGHATLAHILFVYEWNWPAAERALQRAIALDPQYPLVRMYYASYLHSVGRPDEALAQLAVAAELDPLTPTGVLSGRVYVDTQRPEAAIRVLQEEIDLEPRRDLAHQLLAHAYLQKGLSEDAIASMQRAAELSGARDEAQLAYVYAKVGAPEDAHRVLARLTERGVPLERFGFHLAMALGALGDSEAAFGWLEAAYVEHASFMNLLGVSSGFEALRNDPRFTDLLGRMGLSSAGNPSEH